jgi:hypothetical protein
MGRIDINVGEKNGKDRGNLTWGIKGRFNIGI